MYSNIHKPISVNILDEQQILISDLNNQLNIEKKINEYLENVIKDREYMLNQKDEQIKMVIKKKKNKCIII